MTPNPFSSSTLSLLSILLLLLLQTCSQTTEGLTPSIAKLATQKYIPNTALFSTEQNEEKEEKEENTSLTLEDKMKSWEASEEEIKAATLGGVVPGRSDAFDVGLYIAFPIMVISGLLFAAFPFIMSNIDTSSVGPPPTV